MACCIPPAGTSTSTSTSVSARANQRLPRTLTRNSTVAISFCYRSQIPHYHSSTNHIIIPPLLHSPRSLPPFPTNPSCRCRCRCRSMSPGPGPSSSSPDSDPSPAKNPPPSSGSQGSFSKIQDTVQIFLAVLFWMSLFFWASAWDGRNAGRSGKGSRFRR